MRLRGGITALSMVAALAAAPLSAFPDHPANSETGIYIPEYDEDSIPIEKVIVIEAEDTTALFEKLKKSKFVRDFPTVYADTMTFENGKVVFRALIMKKFWRKLKWLYSRERPVKQLPDSSKAATDSVAEERPMVRFVTKE